MARSAPQDVPGDGVDRIYGSAYDERVFVLTHRPPADSEDPRVSLVSDVIEGAVATAQAAAGDSDVGIFGSGLSRQRSSPGSSMSA